MKKIGKVRYVRPLNLPLRTSTFAVQLDADNLRHISPKEVKYALYGEIRCLHATGELQRHQKREKGGITSPAPFNSTSARTARGNAHPCVAQLFCAIQSASVKAVLSHRRIAIYDQKYPKTLEKTD